MENTVIQEILDTDIENKIKLGAYLWELRKKRYMDFYTYIKKKHPHITKGDAVLYMNLYKMCANAEVSLQDIQDIPWWRIKLFLYRITKRNKDEILQAAREMPTKNYRKHMRGKHHIVKKQKVIIYVSKEKEEKFREQLLYIKKEHKFRYIYQALELALTETIEKSDYFKDKWFQEKTLDELLEIITQKFPHLLIEITELEGLDNA